MYVSAPNNPNDQDDAIADSAKPIPTEIPRATGPLLVEDPEMARVTAAAGIAPINAEIRTTPKVIATSVNTGSPIANFNGITLIETRLK
jgi:hypothetical protein